MPDLMARAVHVKAHADELLIELHEGHRVDDNSYVLSEADALELMHQIVAAMIASRGRE